MKSNGVLIIPFPPYAWQFNPAQLLFDQLKFMIINRTKQPTVQNIKDSFHKVLANDMESADYGFAFESAEGYWSYFSSSMQEGKGEKGRNFAQQKQSMKNLRMNKYY